MNQDFLGAEIPKLGFGLMRLPKQGDEVDLEHTIRMVDAYLEAGFTYFDTAYVYINGTSEVIARKAIVDRYPRDAFQLATKLPMWIIEEKAEMERIFQQSLERAGVDYFDFYLLHGLSASTSDRFPMSDVEKADRLGAWEFVRSLKQQGKAKHIGLSFHDTADVLDRLLTDHPEMEFVQLQINYADWEDPVIQARACHQVAMQHGKPVIVMEPVKGGTLLANLRPQVADIFRQAAPEAPMASWPIRYAASLEGIITVLSGMQNLEQVRENTAYMKDFRPLDKTERQVIARAVEALQDVDAISCTACRYCVDDCPQNIPIPHIFEVANDYKVFGNLPYSKQRYRNAVKELGKATDCIACGACEAHCPQKLAIAGLLEETGALLEG